MANSNCKTWSNWEGGHLSESAGEGEGGGRMWTRGRCKGEVNVGPLWRGGQFVGQGNGCVAGGLLILAAQVQMWWLVAKMLFQASGLVRAGLARWARRGWLV